MASAGITCPPVPPPAISTRMGLAQSKPESLRTSHSARLPRKPASSARSAVLVLYNGFNPSLIRLEADMFRFVGFLLLTSLSSAILGQKPSTDSAKPDPAALLKDVKDKYAKANFYNIESIRETQYKGDLSLQWDKYFLNAAANSGNRYRFEGRSDF